MGESFDIDVWSDVVCPFCYLGSRQLHQALKLFAHGDEVVVHHHAFELDPHARLTYEGSLDEMLAAKYSVSLERARELNQRLERQAAELGMSWSLQTAQPTNTFDAHRLIALSATQDKSDVMSERLFRAYFCDGLLISDHELLSELAEEVGVSDAPLLWETEAFANDVRADEASAERLGISGVPAFLIDNAYMVPGAQGAEKIADVLQRAWDRQRA